MARESWIMCDGCGKRANMTNDGAEGWVALKIVIGPVQSLDLAAKTQEPVEHSAELCRSCAIRLRNETDPRAWPKPASAAAEAGTE